MNRLYVVFHKSIDLPKGGLLLHRRRVAGLPPSFDCFNPLKGHRLPKKAREIIDALCTRIGREKSCQLGQSEAWKTRHPLVFSAAACRCEEDSQRGWREHFRQGLRPRERSYWPGWNNRSTSTRVKPPRSVHPLKLRSKCLYHSISRLRARCDRGSPWTLRYVRLMGEHLSGRQVPIAFSGRCAHFKPGEEQRNLGLGAGSPLTQQSLGLAATL